MSTEIGFIKVPNDLHKWEWFSHAKTLQIYMYLRCEARYADGYYHGQKIERGQALVKCDEIAEKFKLSKQQMRTIINRLKSTHKITHEKVLNQSLFTLLDYDCSEEITHDLTDEQHTDNTRATHALSTKKDKKDKKEERDINTEVRNIKKEIKKYIYGEFKHVHMNEGEYEKLVAKYPKSLVDDKIASLDSYIQSGIKKYVGYTDHYATIGNWCRKDSKEAITEKDYGENGIQTWT